MNFRDFLEQGTGVSINGFGAAGRAGQKQHTPEGPVLKPAKTEITLFKSSPNVVKKIKLPNHLKLTNLS